MSVITQKLLLFFITIACCILANAQLPCCQIEPAPNSPFDAGDGPRSVAFSPDGRCLAVANSADSTISIFSVDPITCELTPVGNPVPSGGTSPVSVAFSPDGTCLAVANSSDNTISVFGVNPDTCTLTEDPIDTENVSGSPQSIAYSPDGNCLAVAQQNATISVFPVNSDCTLDDPTVTATPMGTNLVSLAYSPDGNCLAVLDDEDLDAVLIFTVSNCNLVFSSSFNVSSDNPASLAYSPSGNCLAVATPSGVDTFTVDGCNLIANPNNPFDAGITPESVAFSPDGTCLAVTDISSDNIRVFRINGNCSLEEIEGSPFSVGNSPIAVAYSINGCLAVANRLDGNVSVFRPRVVQQPIITSTTVTDCTTVTVIGTAGSNVTITLFANGDPTPIGSGSTDSEGNFTIMTTLPIGTHSITAVATDAEGCTSNPSAPAIVIINPPIITSASLGCGNLVTVIGTSTPNVPITIAIDAVPVATTTASSSGDFIVTGLSVSAGFHCITATDITNGCSSTPVCLNVTLIACVLNAPNLAFGTHCNC